MRVIIALLLSLGCCAVYAQSEVVKINPEVMVYKEVDTISLKLFVYKPLDFDENKRYKTVVLFHGGGWNGGSPAMFRRQAVHFASRGMIAITPEYRLKNKHGTTPFDCVTDAHDVMDFLKRKANKIGIDIEWIAVGGGSAGGHLATTTVFWNTRKPLTKALLLFNPVLDTGPEGYGYRRMEGRHQEISPMHNIMPSQPPTIILIGTQDKIVPVKTVDGYKKKVEDKGGRCNVVFYEGEGHAFFAKKQKYFKETLKEADNFLVSLGFLNEPVKIVK
ncbi:alpha/beta hydrolase fold domain-containing protein [Reichenbachiella sp.]|uniref:alpha/beta hydrolase n=1 Tax=Reichenbachiella sp. TaxID=2184521 RepID=UPI003297D379